MPPLANTQVTAPKARAGARAGWTAGRVASVVVGTTLALCSLAALGAGGVFAVGGVELDLTEPIFVGVAGPAVVHRYLHGSRYTIVHDNGNSARQDGTAPTNAPGAAVDWTPQSTGTKTLRWNRDDGEQVLVAMNADGSPSVSARIVSSTVTLRTTPALAAGLLIGGAAFSRSRSRSSPSLSGGHGTGAEESHTPQRLRCDWR